MKKRIPIPQHEFGFGAGAFNLVGETTDDGERTARERDEKERALVASAQAQRDMFQNPSILEDIPIEAVKAHRQAIPRLEAEIAADLKIVNRRGPATHEKNMALVRLRENRNNLTISRAVIAGTADMFQNPRSLRNRRSLLQKQRQSLRKWPRSLHRRQRLLKNRYRSGLERPWDILDEIASRGAIRTKAKSKPGTEGYYGSAYYELRGPARKLFSDHGQNWDDMLDSLRRDGIMPQTATVDDLQDTMLAAVKARRAHHRGETPEARQFKFQQALAANAKRKGTVTIPVNVLKIGERFSIGDDRFTVTGIDPDTEEVEVRNGAKFGTQQIPDGALIAVNKGSLEKKRANTRFLRAVDRGPGPRKTRSTRKGKFRVVRVFRGRKPGLVKRRRGRVRFARAKRRPIFSMAALRSWGRTVKKTLMRNPTLTLPAGGGDWTGHHGNAAKGDWFTSGQTSESKHTDKGTYVLEEWSDGSYHLYFHPTFEGWQKGKDRGIKIGGALKRDQGKALARKHYQEKNGLQRNPAKRKKKTRVRVPRPKSKVRRVITRTTIRREVIAKNPARRRLSRKDVGLLGRFKGFDGKEYFGTLRAIKRGVAIIDYSVPGIGKANSFLDKKDWWRFTVGDGMAKNPSRRSRKAVKRSRITGKRSRSGSVIKIYRPNRYLHVIEKPTPQAALQELSREWGKKYPTFVSAVHRAMMDHNGRAWKKTIGGNVVEFKRKN